MPLQTKTQTLALAPTRFTSAVDRRSLDYIRKHRIFTPGEHVLVGASGGPDSTALLGILSRLRAKLDINLTVAHFDHMLRTREEAEDDARFVTEIAAAVDVRLVTGAADVRASARRHHRSLEDAARRLRYAFLGEKAAATGASCVSIGHTLDDQAETVLLHLLRGSGLGGLAAMRPRAPWPFGAGPDLARPILGLRRADTDQYCRELGIEPRTDPTNDLPIAARNRVRNELVPVLRSFNPRIDEAIARLAEAAASESGYLDELARSNFRDIASTTPTAVSLSRRDLLAAHPAMARRIIRLALEQASGAAVDIESVHVEALLDALAKPPGSYSLPGGLTATTDDRALIIRRGAASAAEKIQETKLSVPGETVGGVWAISTELSSVSPELSRVGPDEAYLDAEASGCALNLRSRRPGDRLRPLGLGGEKKLQDILVDAKVPARERDGVPLVCAGDQIAWVVGHCIDERFAITRRTRNAIHILVSRSPGE
jgi:tRNA(Ile)-lysidine synthase